MTKESLYKHVILSGANLRGARMIGHARKIGGVEGSPVAWQSGKLHEILRLRKSRLSPRFAPLRMTGKMKSLFFVTIALFFASFTGCDQPIESQYSEQLVINTFLFTNHPIDSIVLHRTTPFGDTFNDLEYAITGATVIVTNNGVSDTLLPGTLSNPSLKGRYYLPASKLIVQGGQTYNLTVIAPDQQTGGTHFATATTTVPMTIHLGPIADSLRGQTIILDTNHLADFAFLMTAGPVDEPSRQYLLSVTALDTNDGRIHTGGDSSAVLTRYSMIATGPQIALTSRFFAWYGPSLITFYAIDSNFANYQAQLSEGSDYQPTLNDINGGIGVFGSAAIDTVSFILAPKQ